MSDRQLPRAIHPSAVVPAEHAMKHVVVVLPPEMTLEHAIKTPDTWRHVQSNLTTRLKLFDEATLIAYDGSACWRRCPVVKVLSGGGLLLGKPSKMDQLEVERPDVLFENYGMRVVPHGSGFAVETQVRGHRGATDTWHPGSVTYHTEAQAKQALLASIPRDVA
jgi:hypothetical protein